MPRWVGKWGKYPAKPEQYLLPLHRLLLLKSLRVSWRVFEARIRVWKCRNPALGKHSPESFLPAVLVSRTFCRGVSSFLLRFSTQI